MPRITGGKKDRDPTVAAKRMPVDKSGTGPETSERPNPDPEADKLVAGTVHPAPDRPGPRVGEATANGGEAFDDFAKQVLASLGATASRMRTAHAERLTEQKQLVALLASAPLKRAVEVDPELRAQVAEAGQLLKKDQEQSREAEAAMAAWEAMAGAELATLGKLLG
jgi:hypothetical protein